jgi:hypothetical protein
MLFTPCLLIYTVVQYTVYVEQTQNNYQCTCCLYGAGHIDFDASNIYFDGHWKDWALKSQRAKRVPFGPKKVEISGPTPSNDLSNGFAASKSLSPRAIYKKTVTLVILCTWVSGPIPSNGQWYWSWWEGSPQPPPTLYSGGGWGAPAVRKVTLHTHHPHVHGALSTEQLRNQQTIWST